ncbi:MAG: hypothetical protein JW788_04875 [Candidatus Omnitrophica bacterium]|nr:hypothetical protein [Candidatus Omnitrophota bacterium]
MEIKKFLGVLLLLCFFGIISVYGLEDNNFKVTASEELLFLQIPVVISNKADLEVGLRTKKY